MSGYFRHCFTVFVIILVYGSFSCLCDLLSFCSKAAANEPLRKGLLPDPLPEISIIRHIAGYYILSQPECGISIRYLILFGNVFFCLPDRIIFCISGEQVFRKTLQALFPGDICTCLSFWFIRSVKVFQHDSGRGIFYPGSQFISEFALLFDGRQDRFLSVFKIAQISEPFVKISKGFIVHCAGSFLTVARNKRYGAAAVDQFCDCLSLPELYP